MKIGIIGVPGVGKSDLANSLAKELDDSVVIDDYVEEISQDTGIALGIFASYPGNLAISVGRMIREFKEKDKGHILTVGTDIDTMLYAAVDAVNATSFARDDTEKDLIKERSATIMKQLAFMFIDCGRYDQIFYIAQPSEDKDPQDWKSQLDDNIPQALDLYGIPYATLNGTLEENLEKALNDIRDESKTAKAAEAN